MIPNALASDLACNVAWPVGERLTGALDWYSNTFDLLRDGGVRIVRIWAPPWLAEADRPESGGAEALLAWRARYFRRVLDVAERHGIRLIVCLLSHVELLDRAWEQEVERRAHSWAGNAFNLINGGWCREPFEFFVNGAAVAATSRWLASIAPLADHPAFYGWELINEADRIDDFEPRAFCDWAGRAAAILKAGRPSAVVTVSLADCRSNRRVWSVPGIDLIQVHTHGWPYGDPLANILACQRAVALVPAKARHGSVPGQMAKPDHQFFCGEFSWNSQVPDAAEQRREIPRVVAGSILAGCALPALPWWWDGLIADASVRKVLRQLSGFLDAVNAEALGPFVPTSVTERGRPRRTSASGAVRNAFRLLLNRSSMPTLPAIRRALRLVQGVLTGGHPDSGLLGASDGTNLVLYVTRGRAPELTGYRLIRSLDLHTGDSVDGRLDDIGAKPPADAYLLHAKRNPDVQ